MARSDSYAWSRPRSLAWALLTLGSELGALLGELLTLGSSLGVELGTLLMLRDELGWELGATLILGAKLGPELLTLGGALGGSSVNINSVASWEQH